MKSKVVKIIAKKKKRYTNPKEIANAKETVEKRKVIKRKLIVAIVVVFREIVTIMFFITSPSIHLKRQLGMFLIQLINYIYLILTS